MQYAVADQDMGDALNTPCHCEAYRHPHRPGGGDCRGHDLADCPSQRVVVDPYATGDRWYRWVDHGCLDWTTKQGYRRHA